ncbi:hypothetical protein ISX56_34965, partial [Serratia ureilytica]|nr:hypothetical protein [Serratia ureilytica]
TWWKQAWGGAIFRCRWPSRLPPSRFVPLNILGAILWATIFVMLGYFGGQAIERFVTGFDKKLSSLLFVALAIAAILLVRFWFWIIGFFTAFM